MDRKAFTLIEILVVIAIIGLVTTFAAIAVNAAREKQRDAVRISHVRQIQSALEEYFIERNAYPAAQGLALGLSSAGCLDRDGFQPSCDPGAANVLLRKVPMMPAKGLKGLSTCGALSDAYCYATLEGAETYRIQFELERGVPLAELARGLNCASPEGISPGACQ
jgi:prepilin-type N-terminal cleavage/methylation domain-containing protein